MYIWDVLCSGKCTSFPLGRFYYCCCFSFLCFTPDLVLIWMFTIPHYKDGLISHVRYILTRSLHSLIINTPYTLSPLTISCTLTTNRPSKKSTESIFGLHHVYTTFGSSNHCKSATFSRLAGCLPRLEINIASIDSKKWALPLETYHGCIACSQESDSPLRFPTVRQYIFGECPPRKRHHGDISSVHAFQCTVCDIMSPR